MATQRKCPGCSEDGFGKLFDIFDSLSKNNTVTCSKCGWEGRNLLLRLDFGLDAEKVESEIEGCFLPKKIQEWLSSGKQVKFYPFLVVLKNSKEQIVWLPYYHKHGNKSKYGQWAPCMSAGLFLDLIEQAKPILKISVA